MRTRTARTLVSYADGRRIRARIVEPGADVPELVRVELLELDETAEVVVLDGRGHRLERWCRRDSLVVRDWALPGIVARAPERSSSSRPPPAPEQP